MIASRRYTDLYEWGRWTMPVSLAAEIQHQLLPGSFTCEAGQLTLAAWQEPTSQVGGDTFDFALDAHVLHLSITDAMGHGVNAALLATLLVGALRKSRRHGDDPGEQARLANQALVDHNGDEQFVTGQLVRADLYRGTAAIVNAGHPRPWRVRAGDVEQIDLRADPAFGMMAASRYRVQRVYLEPGDRLILLTDGMLERNAAQLDLRKALARAADAHPREVVHQLAEAVLDATGGNLRDDATVMCIDWYGAETASRHSAAGANQAPASSATT
ncbi:MAG: PP2C family protein-serine/threonine phosphatase [Acidimicrobiales bacterium]